MISFPPGTKMFQFPGFPTPKGVITEVIGSPIRQSRDQRLHVPTPRLSQLGTTFLGARAKPFPKRRSSRRLLAQLTSSTHMIEIIDVISSRLGLSPSLVNSNSRGARFNCFHRHKRPWPPTVGFGVFYNPYIYILPSRTEAISRVVQSLYYYILLLYRTEIAGRR